MSIDSKHPLYKTYEKIWKRCRDCFEGEDAMRSAGAEYVPYLSGMDPIEGTNEYKSYVQRGLFYGALYRTVKALSGAALRKPPTTSIKEKQPDLHKDITNTGVSLEEFTKGVCDELLVVGRGGILVDMSDDAKPRPYFCFYNAENIRNWGYDKATNRTFVVLRELVYETDGDEYEQVEIEQRRLVVKTGSVVEIAVFRKGKDNATKDQWVEKERHTLKTRSGDYENFPFVFASPTSKSNKIEKPPLIDLANVNVAHWRNSVDNEYGLHLLGLPTPYMTGVDSSDKTPVPLGPAGCVKLTDPNSKFGFATFEGEGMGTLASAMEKKEELMASLGARMLASTPKAVEAAETAKIHQSGESNTLLSLVSGVEDAVRSALEIAVGWMGGGDKVEFEMSRDFTNIAMDPQALTALFQIVQGNKMSIESFLWNLQQGEVLPPDRTIEQERELIDRQKEEAMEQAMEAMGGAEGGPFLSPGTSKKPGDDKKGAPASGKGPDKTGAKSGSPLKQPE